MSKHPRALKWLVTICPIAALMVAVGAGLSLSGCNTVEGAGEDIQDLGSGIEDAAD
jgi:predicted small secreted protein